MSAGALRDTIRSWTLDRISVRMRLALWYSALLFVTLTLFSFIVFTVAQSELQSEIDSTLAHNAQVIASTLQGELTVSSTSGPKLPPVLTPTVPAPTPTAQPATPSPVSTGSARPSPTRSEPTPSPVPTADPAQQAKIQQRLNLSGIVPDVLGRLDLTFEVLDTRGAVDYYAPNVTTTGLPRNMTVINNALQNGICGEYSQLQNGSLLRVYVYPISLPQKIAGGHTIGSIAPGSGACVTSTGKPVIVGAVLVAKSMDELNSTLHTLSQLLVIGIILAVLSTSVGGWIIAGNGLRPIASVTRTARVIAVNAHASGLGRRVGYRGPRDEVGELASTFDDMIAAIERVANAQRRFVADASHELRAPLTTIKGSVEFLRRVPDLPEEERAAVLDDAFTEADRMATLVNDLLLLARADAAVSSAPGTGEVRLDEQMRGRREPVELDQLVLDTFRHGRAQLQARREKGIQLAIETLEPEVVMADPGQLRQVMLILLDNALKYTPPGGRVSLAVGRTGSRATISVRDTGIGIEPDVLPHIFDRFYRGDQARERDQHGSGLGLAIAKWIVEAHQGEITVTSQPGKGSKFEVLLPASKRVGEQPSTKLPTPRKPVASRSRVAEAMSPLTRLAGAVSQPRRLRLDVRKAAREGLSGSSGKTERVRRHKTKEDRTPGGSH